MANVTSYKQVGDNIAKAMLERKLSRSMLANQLSLSEDVLDKIIRGSKAVNIAELSRIANALDTTVEDLMTVENAEEEHTIRFNINEKRLDEPTKKKLDTIRQAISEITMLEELE